MTLSPLTPALLAAPRAHHTLIPHWIGHLGPLGLFAAAAIDASVVPLPVPGTTDLLLLLLVSHGGNPWLLAALAIAGSIVGGYSTWHIGRRGGEAALKRYVPRRLLERVRQWLKRNPVQAVFLPSTLPPPIPLSPFLLAAGALGVSRSRFLMAFGAARSLRYAIVAWIGVKYGRHVVRIWSALLARWSTPLLWVFGAVMVAGIGFTIFKLRKAAKSDSGEGPAREAAAY